MSIADVTFPSMGSEVRFLIESADPEDAVRGARDWLEAFERRLSRFRADSELSRLNADPRRVIPASALLRTAVVSGLWAATRTRGLVDPTLLAPLRKLGYAHSRAGVAPASLREALAAAPRRRPASPDPAARWREILVDDDAGTISRPRGLEIDSGGVGKGLAADALAHRLDGHSRFAIDCGGDVRVGGAGSVDEPFEIAVRDPFTGEVVHQLMIGGGAIATSGIDVRLWRAPDGGFAHHLLDPSTGTPAWTGVVAATALASTALEAETLAKAAVLSGPRGARTLLAEQGGVVFHEDGDLELVGALRPHRIVGVDELVKAAA